MRDNHLHTHHSYDSDADFKDYLDTYQGEIVTTEHYDLSNPYTKQDDVPDYEAYSGEIAELNRIYDNRIKRGIEIGYYEPREADILSFLADKDYDLKLLSVHHNGVNDYLDDEVADMDKHAIIQEYLDKLEYAIGRVEADVLAHFDYGFRLFQVTVDELAQYEDQLRRIFRKMIAADLAFELNSKSMYLYHHEHLYRYALGLVKEEGCHKYSIGSDGHKLEHFRLSFDKISAILEEFDIPQEEIL
ncbi:PHP domain-containing protein [Streptococcus loxodontisalivarius]|uniref:Histidinol-phosphatase n=1 Tax=Streptococcus loxodontisalivarius TaxID=1349415 RepID=A0ABS2PSV8_9STRE|nr:PHP domain-containing protein [Streptococcus loxodontisalivarius]MBM7642630.1 histidinol-phosphatase (PHP family) [Streptococcus loxodontisalivarius]